MDLVSYTKDNTTYYIAPIEDYSSISKDIDSVFDELDGTSIAEYRLNMEISVDQRLAYSVYKEGERVGFVYNRLEGNRYYGCSIFIWGDKIAMFIALKTMFEIVPSHKLEFAPHKNNLKYFKSVVTGTSIRKYHRGNPTVTVLRKDLVAIGFKIYKYLDLKQAWET